MVNRDIAGRWSLFTLTKMHSTKCITLSFVISSVVRNKMRCSRPAFNAIRVLTFFYRGLGMEENTWFAVTKIFKKILLRWSCDSVHDEKSRRKHSQFTVLYYLCTDVRHCNTVWVYHWVVSSVDTMKWQSSSMWPFRLLHHSYTDGTSV